MPLKYLTHTQGMWMMLQHDTPDDFVLATGETHPVSVVFV